MTATNGRDALTTDLRRHPRIALSACLAAATALSACSSPLPGVAPLATQAQVVDRTLDKEYTDNPHQAVEHVHVRTSALAVMRLNSPVSKELRKKKVDYVFGSVAPTLSDLVQTLGADEVQVSLQLRPTTGSTAFSGGKDQKSIPALLAQSAVQTQQVASGVPAGGGPSPFPDVKLPAGDLSQRRIPFTRFKGTLGGLLDALQTSAGLVTWQDGETIYINDTDRYAVTVPQNDDIIKSLSGTLQELGASEVVASTDGGRIIYSAPAILQKETIAPYLKQHLRNLATISMQIAIVSLAINDKSGVGFDWSQLSLALSQAGLASSTLNSTGTGSTVASNSLASTSLNNVGTTTTGTTTGTSGLLGTSSGTTGSQSATLSTASTALNLGATLGAGKILGVQSAITVAGAVNYLSVFGTTTVTQNVQLRTISGKPVKLESGDKIPYVKGIGLGQLGSGYGGQSSGYGGSGYGSGFGTAQTDNVETGIKLEIMPRYDSNNDLVVADLKMTLQQLIEFVTLQAGSQLGNLTQPHTAKQELNDILRIRAGQTAIVGGLQADTEAKNGNEPTALRDMGDGRNYGSRSQNIQRNALFIILRPTVVVYDPEGPAR